jgi:hypothetical protein
MEKSNLKKKNISLYFDMNIDHFHIRKMFEQYLTPMEKNILEKKENERY